MTLVAKIMGNGRQYIIIKTDNEYNPFTVKARWFNTKYHAKTLGKYADMASALLFVADEIAHKIYI